MPTVYLMHGVVQRPRAGAFVDRNMLDEDAFAEFLQRKTPRFGALEDALAGRCDALTVDDATHASRQAALLAREFGHEVTLFVNPSNVESGRPYWFYLVNLLLDRTPCRSCWWNGDDHGLANGEQKRAFRHAFKTEVCKLATEEACEEAVFELAELLRVDAWEMPPSLQVVSRQALQEMLADGVRLENHGWTHCPPGGMARVAFVRDIERGRVWLRQTFGIDSRVYAVPFGAASPPYELSADVCETWLMADRRFFPGHIGKRIFNRVILNSRDLALSAERMRAYAGEAC